MKKSSCSNITSLEEKPMMTFFIDGGIYIINPKALEHINDVRFLDMPTLFETFHEYWLDIGSNGDFERAQQRYD